MLEKAFFAVKLQLGIPVLMFLVTFLAIWGLTHRALPPKRKSPVKP